ncbi:M23 family metallopeptidase [Brevibacillus sp. SYP-B805]|uniref:LysM peptidoglycan-binding domain-containing M23 family metallopeptidase n=1 Tax=Brevibacillus sp. SYP-B805 TaxID=1578199 RepID=UPI0013EA43A0|nr:M23 family metallopeptidase [Brevibacillus sp. SYP-B805]NGQ96104.1 M23 family metallopeptidase [Brevibacillus sp. SYP-B805]
MQWAEWKAWIQQRMVPLIQRGRLQAGKIATQAWNFVLAHKKQSAVAVGAILVLTSASAYAEYYYESNIIPIYHVIVNGKEIGVVSSPDVIHNWAAAKLEAEKAKNGLDFKFTDYITFQEERVYKGKYDNAAAIAALSDIASIKVNAVKIVVNGEVIGYAPDQKTAEGVMNRLKEKFSGLPVTGKVQAVAASTAAPVSKASMLKQVRFKEDVKLESDTVPAAQVLTADKLSELLSKGTLKQVIHTVQEGDCITCIAQKYGITSQDIYANNPGITENTVLQLGQQINVTAIRPLVTVQVVEEASQEETIDYAVQTRNNAQLPQGDTKVVQEGREGKKLVRYQIIKENGQVVERKVLDQKVLVAPVSKIIERGTKVIPSRGTGRLSWPARGYISSGFGMRWGRLHAGIDIAGSGSIRAADNGRVILAGWHGDYGNCVIIDHGNGLQTLYGHMRSISVHEGQVVAKGKVLGVMGSTGDSTGVHLHFEVRKGGRPMNPLRFLN